MSWVLVWDLDDTIAHWKDEPGYEFILNPKALEVLELAVQKRKEGKVDAILLLTNNGNTTYINTIKNKLLEEINAKIPEKIDIVFNGQLTASDADAKYREIPVRANGKSFTANYAEKRVKDVEGMLQRIPNTILTDNLIHRILFFDDMQHVLSKELEASGKGANHIVVQSFNKDGSLKAEDMTSWNHAKRLMGIETSENASNLFGGAKRKQTKKSKQKKRVTKSRKNGNICKRNNKATTTKYSTRKAA